MNDIGSINVDSHGFSNCSSPIESFPEKVKKKDNYPYTEKGLPEC